MMQPYFFIRHDGRNVKVLIDEIIYAEAFTNYVRIVTAAKTYLVLISLKQVEQELPKDQFCRVHRAYIIALEHITAFDNTHVFFGKLMVPVSEQYRRVLASRVKVLESKTRRKTKTTQKVKIDLKNLLN